MDLILATIDFVLCFSLTQMARMLERRIACRRNGVVQARSEPVLATQVMERLEESRRARASGGA